MENNVKTTTSNEGGIDIEQYFKGKKSALRKDILNEIELNKEIIKQKHELNEIEFKKDTIERVTPMDDGMYEITVRIPFEFDSTLLGISTNLHDAYQFKKTEELEEELESDGIKLVVKTCTLENHIEVSRKVGLLRKELIERTKVINERVKAWNNSLDQLVERFEIEKSKIESFIHEYNK